MTQLLPRYVDTRIDEERKIARAILDAGERTQTPSKIKGKRTGHRSAEGDHQRLRGIPITTEGIGGVQPGTNPERACIRKLDWRGRDEYAA